MKRMEKDVHDYYETILAAKQELVSTREQADSFNRLANLDALTGVRNKRAYNTEAERLEGYIREGTAEFGLADEFVVILEKREYQRRDELAQEFESIIDRVSSDESLEPWEKLSAAIGYADYDPATDKCVEDMLNRADEHMYEQKKKMKQGTLRGETVRKPWVI